MNRALRAVAIFVALGLAGGGGLMAGRPDLWPVKANSKADVPPQATGAVIYYRNPDGHPQYSLTPAKTPDGRDYRPVMASEDITFDEEATPAPPEGRKIKYYRNPMGLADTSPSPKKDSMGMDYIPVYDSEDDGPEVKIPLGKMQKTGVRSEEVTARVISRPVRASTIIQLDERRVSVVSLRFDAYLEKVADVTTGARVRKGDFLMRLYSPEILAAAAQYHSVLDASVNTGGLRRSNTEGARRRLENMGLPGEAITAIEKTREVSSTIDWRAPREGVVIERAAVEGMRAAAGQTLFRLADISVVWALADVAERDIGSIKVGDPTRVTLRGMAGRVFNGRVDLVYPEINMATRTARVRIELANPDGALMPNMFADAEITTGSSAAVPAVPDSAVIDSGRRRIVILDRGDGRFEPRDVTTGVRGDGLVEIRAGVAIGDRVVVSANFLIDAESNLKAALRGFEQPDQTK